MLLYCTISALVQEHRNHVLCLKACFIGLYQANSTSIPRINPNGAV